MSKKPVATRAEPETTGHVWDGLREYNNPLPRWWLWTFYITIVWALIYTILYPAWPLVNRATQGLIGSDQRAAVRAEIARFEEMNAPVEAKLVAADPNAIAADPELANFVRNAGAAIFQTNCAQCHGSGAAGAVGYPNLLDNDWLWGGTMEDILFTVTHGIRNTTDPDARFSQMPAFGKDELLTPEQIDQVVQYVLKISGQQNDAAQAAAGAQVFAENCAACHGEDGKGMREVGAPNLTDAIWLYGGDAASLTATVTNARYGVMPNWNTRLSEADIRAVAGYVHQLGGGEAPANP
ncbi:MAG: cytochrome-c oxidase, cbb3-type subunit III [Rhodobacteraceae bacterium]|nr:cytochrome-c oxidase, cbb3-type subunit III [Paracoccaceae bacterium]